MTAPTYHPTLAQLRAHMDAYGPDGIMESAQHLSEDDQAALEQDCKRARKAQRFPKRRRLSVKGRKR